MKPKSYTRKHDPYCPGPVEQQKPALVCPHCGADRVKEPCRQYQCAWVATAYSAAKPATPEKEGGV